MTIAKVFSLASLISIGLIVNLAAFEAPSATITVDKSIHFVSPAGDDVLVVPGTYQIDMSGESSMRLGMSGKDPLLIQAQVTKLANAMDNPAMLVADKENSDTQYLVMKLPDGNALFATGSFTDVHSRAISRRDCITRCCLPWPFCGVVVGP